jgi:hypothetical protein
MAVIKGAGVFGFRVQGSGFRVQGLKRNNRKEHKEHRERMEGRERKEGTASPARISARKREVDGQQHKFTPGAVLRGCE